MKTTLPLALFAQLIAISGLVATSLAQPVIALPPETTFGRASSTRPGTIGTGSSTLAALTSKSGQPLPLAKWGPVSLSPYLTYRITRSDGLLNPDQTGDATSVIQTVIVGLNFQIGQSWSLNYTGTQNYYSNPIFKDGLDHELSIGGGKSIGDWKFGIGASFRNASLIQVETGGQTPQDNYGLNANVAYQIGDRTSIESSLSRNARLIKSEEIRPQWTASDWTSWTSDNWLRFQVSQKLSLSAGVSFGYDEIDPGSDMKVVKPQGSLNWRITQKLNFGLQYGIERRDFSDSSVEEQNNIVYSASLGYQLSSVTALTISANRNVTATFYSDYLSENEAWSAGVEQRILQRFSLNASYSQSKMNYVVTTSNFALPRSDRYRSMSARISTALFNRSTASLMYQVAENLSSASGFTFTSHQIGAEFSYKF